MRGRGEAVLEFLVKRAEGAQAVGAIASAIGERDGRAVAVPLRDLEGAGLVQRTREGGLWYPTPRGREVDRLLDEVTHARGGQFRPLKEVGIDFRESYALRRRK